MQFILNKIAMIVIYYQETKLLDKIIHMLIDRTVEK